VPPSSTAAPNQAICTPHRFSRLLVDRTDDFPENHYAYAFPAHLETTDSVAITAVAQAACGLPALTGRHSCPDDIGVSYRLTFEEGGRIVGTIVADRTGCPAVVGLGAAREALSQFWRTLALALRLPDPSRGCDPFIGRLPDTSTGGC
jgi:hypothetical protein